MASDPPSSSLNISGSSQSILGGAVVARSRSASVSGHSTRTSTAQKRPNRKSEPSLHGALRRTPKAKSIMPPPPLNALEIPHEEEIPFQGACAGIPPEGEIEHTTDVRIMNQLVVGLNPNEVFAAFQSQWERINFAESTANQVYEEASSVISQLRSQIQRLIDNHNSQMTQAHDRMMHDIGIRDLQVSQLSNDNSHLQSIVEQLKRELENCSSSKDRISRDFQDLSQRSQFQINHLESELSQARVADAQHRDMIRTLEDRLAALRATSSTKQSSSSVEAPSLQTVGQKDDLVQKRILEAIQHLSTRTDHVESKHKSHNYTDRKISSSASPIKPASSSPSRRRDPLSVSFPDKGDPGGDDGDDNDVWDDDENHSHESEELVTANPTKEKDIVDSRALQHC